VSDVRCTVVILTKDEERRIGGVISAATECGFPVLVVDSGSTDSTKAVVAATPAAWAERPLDDFASQRNWAMDQAGTDYVLFVDADEVLTKELADEVWEAIGTGVAGATIPTLDYFAGRWLLHGGFFPQRHARLLRQGAGKFSRQVHEQVVFAKGSGEVRHLDTPLLHLSHIRLSNYLQKLDRYTEVDAAAQPGRSPALSVARGVLEAAAVLGDRIVRKSAWRDGPHGVVASISYAFYRFTIHAKAATRSPVDEPTPEAGLARWRSRSTG
jgi:glycosyltransferase involved in cell wall biosynthesis